MGNIMLGFPNRIDAATLSGGRWTAGLPLQNLKSRTFSQVARSLDASPQSATFTLDLGSPRTVRMLALINHNISLTGTLRIEAALSADFRQPVLDTTVYVWSRLMHSTWDIARLEWENDNFWYGAFDTEDVEGQTPVSAHVLAQGIIASHWRITVQDEGSAWIEIGRMFIGDAFLAPAINYDYGGSLGYEDATGVQGALSGTEYFDVREPVRVMRFQLRWLTDEEGFARALELTRRAGLHREIFVIADPDDQTYAAMRDFIGRLRTLSPLEQAVYNYNSMAFEIKELR